MNKENTSSVGMFFNFLVGLVIMYIFWAPIIFFIVAPICWVIYATITGIYAATGGFGECLGEIKNHIDVSLVTAILPSGVSAWNFTASNAS